MTAATATTASVLVTACDQSEQEIWLAARKCDGSLIAEPVAWDCLPYVCSLAGVYSVPHRSMCYNAYSVSCRPASPLTVCPIKQL